MSDQSPRATPIVHIDNDRVRVTEWRFEPGASTGFHRHEMDYVIVPLTTGRLRLVGPDGEATEARLEHGTPYFRAAGVEHDVSNANGFAFAFMEIEIKSP